MLLDINIDLLLKLRILLGKLEDLKLVKLLLSLFGQPPLGLDIELSGGMMLRTTLVFPFLGKQSKQLALLPPCYQRNLHLELRLAKGRDTPLGLYMYLDMCLELVLLQWMLLLAPKLDRMP